MASTHQELLNKITEQIEKSVGKFNGTMPDAQQRVYDRLIELLKDLEVSGGKLKNTVENIRRIGQIRSEVENIVLNKGYMDTVMDFAKAFNAVTDLQNNYFGSLISDFKPKKVMKALKNDAIQTTVNQLTEAGISTNVTTGIEGILRTSITTGGSFADLMEQMRKYITTTTNADGTKSLGALERYTQQITTDSLNQYAATYNQTISSDLGLKWFQYTGSLLETSRPWCVHMVDKRYVHVSEFDTVITDNVNGVKIGGKEIPVSKKTGLPSGMINGTNASNLINRRGGWQCGHQFGGVPDMLVPEAIRNKLTTA